MTLAFSSCSNDCLSSDDLSAHLVVAELVDSPTVLAAGRLPTFQ